MNIQALQVKVDSVKQRTLIFPLHLRKCCVSSFYKKTKEKNNLSLSKKVEKKRVVEPGGSGVKAKIYILLGSRVCSRPCSGH